VTKAAIVGAGPHGLATAAYLRAAGVDTRVFGQTLAFWRTRMPHDMLLRSRKRSSNIADPERKLGLDDWAAHEGRSVAKPIPIADFVAYGEWFQAHAVPDVDARHVALVEADGRGFELTLEDGETLQAEHVVVAAGLAPFAVKPAVYDGLDGSLVSHSSEHVTFDAFAGRDVLVVGGGQSALESAALLHEAGAHVEVLVRAETIRWLGDASTNRRRSLRERLVPPTDVGGLVTGWIAAVPDAYRAVPAALRGPIAYRCIRPAGAGWLRGRLAGVPLTTGTAAVSARADGDRVRLALDGSGDRVVDHVLLATGFAVDVTRYAFLGERLLSRLEVERGYPLLDRGLESSVPGLHFVGAPAALSIGPLMRFVVGSWYAAPAVCRRVLGRRQPRGQVSF
jgi:FAD-dependent urate hydroxylase